MVLPTQVRIAKTTAAATNDVVDLCSDSDDEKPKSKEDAPTTSSFSSWRGKKRPLQIECSAPVQFSTTEDDCVVVIVTEEELSSNKRRKLSSLSLPVTASTRVAVATQSGTQAAGSSTSINIVPPPLIYIDGVDNLTITEGIFELLSTHFPNIKTPGSDTVTCVGQTTHATATAAASCDVNHASSTTTLRHIEQKDKWSCGFRNLQMMLTALLPILPPDHTYFQDIHGGGSGGGPRDRDQAGSFAIYSLRQIQELLEVLWKAGWDTAGARHFQNRIVGKTSQIGAVEVSSALSFRGVDNVVVQFIKCAESRRQLGPFCWAYFNRRSGCCSTCRSGFAAAAATGTHNSNSMSSQAIAERLLASHNNAVGVGAAGGVVSCSCSCSILPLYLQWEGHSVTIMGVERQTNGGMNLLVLDPVKDGTKLKQALSRSNIAPARLPCMRLQAKDCQIVMCTNRPLSMYEMQERRRQVCAVTAAQDAVLNEDAVMKIAQRFM